MKSIQLVKGFSGWHFVTPSLTDELEGKMCEAWDHYDTGHYVKATKLCNEVLAQCSVCIDALYLQHMIRVPRDSYIYLQAAVGIGLQAIPPEFNWQTDRMAWRALNNRSFMRAYHALGLWYLREKAFEDAEEIFARLISVDPNDNLGCRCLLPVALLSLGKLESLLNLCDQYPDGAGIELLYGRALAFSALGEKEHAESALRDAVADRPLVAKELLKTWHAPPKNYNPYFVALGSAAEAYGYWKEYGQFWFETPSAMALLAEASQP